jgi:hypothetical protein
VLTLFESYENLSLAKIVDHMESMSVDEAKRVMAFIKNVRMSEYEDFIVTPELEEMARTALSIPPEKQDAFMIAKILGVGILTGKKVESILSTIRPSKEKPRRELPPAEKVVRPPAKEEEKAGAAAKADASLPVGALAIGEGMHAADMDMRIAVEKCAYHGRSAIYTHTCGIQLCKRCLEENATCPSCGGDFT